MTRSTPRAGSLVSPAALRLLATLLAAATLSSCGLFRNETPEERDARRYKKEREERVKSQEYYKKLNSRKARKYQRDQRYEEWFNTIMQ